MSFVHSDWYAKEWSRLGPSDYVGRRAVSARNSAPGHFFAWTSRPRDIFTERLLAAWTSRRNDFIFLTKKVTNDEKADVPNELRECITYYILPIASWVRGLRPPGPTTGGFCLRTPVLPHTFSKAIHDIFSLLLLS